MLIGYARVSTNGQDAGFGAQLRELEAAGAERIFQEKVSSVGERTELAAALDHLRAGDVLVVTRLDRLARSVAHFVEIAGEVEREGASLRVLNLNLETASPTGRLMMNLLAGIAQFEREILLERQREGIAKAKAEGKYKGRKPTARAKRDQMLALKAAGIGAAEIARRLGIGRASVYRALGAMEMNA
jgi:DNA invertase Pin-like site-specific DNA recombinase